MFDVPRNELCKIGKNELRELAPLEPNIGRKGSSVFIAPHRGRTIDGIKRKTVSCDENCTMANKITERTSVRRK
jgi:hypothetical protein